ncbi:MAG: NYN domain-containing protein [Verrucomicrobia bacterium]|nr:NYN domain-containing protein [Verrucomicrobiota bacterium]
MSIVAILVDGGFFHRRANYLWGESSPDVRADELYAYCRLHITSHDKLYRIFYYDCPPSEKKVFHPLTKKQVDLARTDMYKWMISFQDAMKTKRKVALRMGHLLDTDLQYVIRPDLTKKLCNGKLRLEDLTETDFALNIVQKGVDMKIGVDIASMAYKKQVNKMILIAGDSDFVPAAKLARREGIDFVLDPMGASIRPDLSEHIDGLVSPRFVPKREQIATAIKNQKEEEDCPSDNP